ncbi:MAG: 1-acyl-sn-glycerol-3-phosphate acyltransferase [Acidobacteria bacterium]|nr:1-acyl-sn-glycerol-3-phosphate acyltransferase [Acidobacteriota bacterium]
MLGVLRAALLLSLLALNLMLIGTPVALIGILKWLTPGRLRREYFRVMDPLARAWVTNNDRIFDAVLPTRYEVRGLPDAKLNGRFLIISNHVSWIDIVVIFRVFNGVLPFIRFFLKWPLLLSPVLGQACWAMDFPFMRRYSTEYLEKHPEKRGADLQTTRTACRRYKKIPVSILNFVEGTRFSHEKHANQESPYRHLLRPRYGGISYVFASMGDMLDAMYDVTLAFPGIPDPTFWLYISGQMPRIVIDVREIPLRPEFFEESVTRPGPNREAFKAWMSAIWEEKDRWLDERVRTG